MSRRRKPRTPATSSTPPNDGTPLGGLSDADLLREVARRRLTRGSFDIDAIEELAGAAQRDMDAEVEDAPLHRAEQLAALDDVVGYYRTNEKRMRYRQFRSLGLPVGSGIVESAHRHVLQVRMKRAGQRWGMVRARRMVRLREGLKAPASTHKHQPRPNAPRRVKRTFALHRGSPLNRAALASK